MTNFREIDSHIEELVRGSIDMHVHFGPDPHFIRRLDAMQTAQHAQDVGQRAIVLKHSDYPTAPLAAIISRVVTETAVFGSIVLNFEVGGLNVHAVESSAKMGAKVVWMPTLASANCRAKIGSFLGADLKGEGISILDEEGALLPQVESILSIARQYDMVVASGHIAPEEMFKLVDCAQEMGIQKIVATHVLSTGKAFEKTLSLDEQQLLATRGVVMEHVLCSMMPTFSRLDPKEVVKAIKAVGVGNCIISTDLGQAYHPPPAEGMRMFVGILLRSGLTPQEIELMVKSNPARLLGL